MKSKVAAAPFACRAAKPYRSFILRSPCSLGVDNELLRKIGIHHHHGRMCDRADDGGSPTKGQQ